MTEFIDELERLEALHARGALTGEEFVAAKAKLLGTETGSQKPRSVQWETCKFEVEVTERTSFARDMKRFRFVVKSVGPGGTSTIARSPVMKYINRSDYPGRTSEIEGAHSAILSQLYADGWELTGRRQEFHGEVWWACELRREWRPDLRTQPHTEPESEWALYDELIRHGEKLKAIKLYRIRNGIGLREAKAAIDERQRQI